MEHQLVIAFKILCGNIVSQIYMTSCVDSLRPSTTTAVDTNSLPPRGPEPSRVLIHAYRALCMRLAKRESEVFEESILKEEEGKNIVCIIVKGMLEW